MKVKPTAFRDLVILEPTAFEDARGLFFESYNERTFQSLGLDFRFVQDNQSCSKRGVLRGLHFQAPPHAQTKLVRVLSGVIQDVVVDLRSSEPTFGKYFSIALSSTNRKQLLVPKGFAHGFLVLSETAHVLYKSDTLYEPSAERGIRFDDNHLNVRWMEKNPDEFFLSEKDRKLPKWDTVLAELLST